MSEIKWFKVLTDMFADDKIKLLQAMPEGDALLVMWFKVLAQAGKTNDGGYIYLKKSIPYTAGMLSTLFGKHQQLVELALRTFTEFGMIDMDERGYIFVTNWEKHQNIEGMEKVRDQTRKRVQAHRQKKRLELNECNVTGSVTVTRRNATDIEEELDKDIKTTTTTENDVFRKYQNEIGIVSSTINEMLQDDVQTYGNEWVSDAITEAVLNNVRKYSYIRSILERWKTQGRDAQKQPEGGGYRGQPRNSAARMETTNRELANQHADLFVRPNNRVQMSKMQGHGDDPFI